MWHKKTPGRNGKARNLGLSTGGLLMEFFCGSIPKFV